MISIVIAAYNAEAFVAQAVESILMQDSHPLEVIVVDDGSSDTTAQIAENFGAPVICIRAEHKGPAAARNRGLDIARGDFIGFLDADDLLTPGALVHQMAVFDSHPEVDVAMGLSATEDLVSGPGEPMVFKSRGTDNPMVIQLGRGLYRRSVFDRVGRFDPELIHAEDMDWLSRVREFDILALMHDHVVLRYRRHTANMSSDLAASKMFRAMALKRSLDRRRAAGSGQAEPTQSFAKAFGLSPISVIVPCYNAAPYLAETLCSILAQVPAPAEIIVVDDGSSDGSVAVARGFGVRVKIIELPHGGHAVARNAGIAAARGTLLLQVDADDLLMPGAIAAALKAFDDHSDAELVLGQFECFFDPAMPEECRARYALPEGPQRAHFSNGAVIRSSTFKKVGMLDETYTMACELEWMARAHDIGVKTQLVPQVMARRRIHGANISITRKEELDADRMRILRASLARRRKSAATDTLT